MVTKSNFYQYLIISFKTKAYYYQLSKVKIVDTK